MTGSRWSVGETWRCDVTNRVPWSDTLGKERCFGLMKLTWVSDEVVEGFVTPPKGSTRQHVKTTLPAYSVLERVRGA